MKYSTIAKHSFFAVAIRTCPVPVQSKPSFYKLFPFLRKEFPRVFGHIKSCDLICISSIRQIRDICLPKVYVDMKKASESRPPPNFLEEKDRWLIPLPGLKTKNMKVC